MSDLQIVRANQEIIEKARLLFPDSFGREFKSEDWHRKYFLNPCGESFAYAALDGDNVVSFYSYHPQFLQINGAEQVIYQDADAMTDPAYRRRGLYRGIKQIADKQLIGMGIPFAISFPNEANLLATKEFGAVFVGCLTRWVRPVSSHGYKGIKKLGISLGISVSSLFNGRKPKDKVELVEAYDQRFDGVWNQIKHQFTISGVHDLKYLKWRYEGRKDIFAWLHGKNKPDGLVIAEKYDDYLCIHDLLIPSANLFSFRELVAEMRIFCLHNNLNRISFPTLGSTYNHLLRWSGFFPLKGRSPFRLNQLAANPQQWADKKLWFISNADRDWQ
jgi:hypothetical protein